MSRNATSRRSLWGYTCMYMWKRGIAFVILSNMSSTFSNILTFLMTHCKMLDQRLSGRLYWLGFKVGPGTPFNLLGDTTRVRAHLLQQSQSVHPTPDFPPNQQMIVWSSFVTQGPYQVRVCRVWSSEDVNGYRQRLEFREDVWKAIDKPVVLLRVVSSAQVIKRQLLHGFKAIEGQEFVGLRLNEVPSLLVKHPC